MKKRCKLILLNIALILSSLVLFNCGGSETEKQKRLEKEQREKKINEVMTEFNKGNYSQVLNEIGQDKNLAKDIFTEIKNQKKLKDYFAYLNEIALEDKGHFSTNLEKYGLTITDLNEGPSIWGANKNLSFAEAFAKIENKTPEQIDAGVGALTIDPTKFEDFYKNSWYPLSNESKQQYVNKLINDFAGDNQAIKDVAVKKWQVLMQGTGTHKQFMTERFLQAILGGFLDRTALLPKITIGYTESLNKKYELIIEALKAKFFSKEDLERIIVPSRLSEDLVRDTAYGRNIFYILVEYYSLINLRKIVDNGGYLRMKDRKTKDNRNWLPLSLQGKRIGTVNGDIHDGFYRAIENKAGNNVTRAGNEILESAYDATYNAKDLKNPIITENIVEKLVDVIKEITGEESLRELINTKFAHKEPVLGYRFLPVNISYSLSAYDLIQNIVPNFENNPKLKNLIIKKV